MEIDSVLACRKGVTWGGGFVGVVPQVTTQQVGVVPRKQHKWVWSPGDNTTGGCGPQVATQQVGVVPRWQHNR